MRTKYARRLKKTRKGGMFSFFRFKNDRSILAVQALRQHICRYGIQEYLDFIKNKIEFLEDSPEDSLEVNLEIVKKFLENDISQVLDICNTKNSLSNLRTSRRNCENIDCEKFFSYKDIGLLFQNLKVKDKKFIGELYERFKNINVVDHDEFLLPYINEDRHKVKLKAIKAIQDFRSFIACSFNGNSDLFIYLLGEYIYLLKEATTNMMPISEALILSKDEQQTKRYVNLLRGSNKIIMTFCSTNAADFVDEYEFEDYENIISVYTKLLDSIKKEYPDGYLPLDEKNQRINMEYVDSRGLGHFG